MSSQSQVVFWKDVRNHELSEVITRRQAVGLLGANVIDQLMVDWSKKGIVPDRKNWSTKLAVILEEWLDIGQFEPQALRATVARWQNIGRATPQEPSLTEFQCKEALHQPFFQKLSEILTPRDLDAAVAVLPVEIRRDIERRWIAKGWLPKDESPLLPPDGAPTLDVLNALDQRARGDLDKSIAAHKVESIRILLEKLHDVGVVPLSTLALGSPGSVNPFTGTPHADADAKDADAHAHPDDKELQEYQKVSAKEWLSAPSVVSMQGLALDALILEALMRAEVSTDLVGLALSGGGIRSASFNLGLLQSLQKDRLLRDLDYLSTVSGGGYVGSFFSSMMHTQDVHLDPGLEKEPPLARAENGKQPEPVVKLVRSGSFLNKPLVHASRYVIGLLLNNLVLLSALLAACTAIALAWRGMDLYPVEAWIRSGSFGLIRDWNRPFLPGLAMLLAWFLISGGYLFYYGPHGQPKYGHLMLAAVGLFFLIGAAVALATPNLDFPLLVESRENKPNAVALNNTPAYILMLLISFGVIPFLKPWRFLASGTQPSGQTDHLFFRVFSILLLGGIPFFLVHVIARHDIGHDAIYLLPESARPINLEDTSKRKRLDITDIQYERWSPFWQRLMQEAGVNDKPVELAVAGMARADLKENEPSIGYIVWSRLSNVQKDIIATLTRDKDAYRQLSPEQQQIVDGVNTLPIPLDDSPGKIKKKIVDEFNEQVIDSSEFTEAVLGKPGAMNKARVEMIRSKAENMIEKARLLALLNHYEQNRLLPEDKQKLNRLLLEAYYGWAIWERAVVRRSLVIHQDEIFRLYLLGITVAIALISSLLVNLNATSLHGIYRQQLSWLYLNPVATKKPDPYLPLHEVNTTKKGAPYHLITASLDKGTEQTEGTRPTVQFLFSPGYCGSKFTGFVATKDYQEGTIDLGTAMAISGAAFSPARVENRLIAFLMLVLNVRLGQWLPSPRFPTLAHRLPILQLLASLAIHRGIPDRRFWFVTDGGHSENLGLGPLLRRECKLMIVSDAGQDPDYGFDDFVALYRHARTEGVRFETLDQNGFMRMDPLMPNKEGMSTHRYLVARVTYPGPEKKSGLLIYIKPSFGGDESVDLVRYRRVNTQFPHDPTVNQWFDEAQVESYRELGALIGQRVGHVLSAHLRPRHAKHIDFDDIIHAIENEVKAGAAARVEAERAEPVLVVKELATTLPPTLLEVPSSKMN